MLRCKDVVERASRYIDGEMSWSRRLGMRLHLMMCIHCRRFMRQFRMVRDTLGHCSERQPEPTEQSLRELVEKLRKDGD